MDIREYMNLNDHIIEVDLTPNRADCLSVGRHRQGSRPIKQAGLAALTEEINNTGAAHSDSLSITVHENAACPRYLGTAESKALIHQAETPGWMQEKLTALRAEKPGACSGCHQLCACWSWVSPCMRLMPINSTAALPCAWRSKTSETGAS